MPSDRGADHKAVQSHSATTSDEKLAPVNEKLADQPIDDNSSTEPRGHDFEDEESGAIALDPRDPGPPPDGGWTAWAQVLVGALVNVNGFGYITSFGLFQSYYETTLNRPPSDISWIGSIDVCLVFLVGVFSGRIADAGHPRLVLTVGAVLQLVGVFTTSIATQYWQLLLAQGLCTGIGLGLLFCPTVSIVASYFSTKRSLALSTAAAGGAAGGLIYPAIARQLLPSIGVGWTVRVMGFVMIFNFIPVLLLVKNRMPPRQAGPFVEWSAFRDVPYLLFAIGMFLNGWGVYFVYYYAATYAEDILHLSDQDAFVVLLIVNGLGIPGRIIPALLADRYFGPLNMLIPTALLSGVLILCWIAVDSFSGYIAFIVIIGYVAAGVQSLFPSTLSSLSRDLSKLGTRIGMVFTIYGLATLTGTPIAGALITKDGGSYLYAQLFAGLCLCCGSATLLVARQVRLGRTLWQKI